MKEVGHQFLARLGKKRLRPGGITGTRFLFENSEANAKSKVLEIACNRALNAIAFSRQFNCEMVGVDIDPHVVKQAIENVASQNLSHKIKIVEGSAFSLPFADESFDIVVNEAMLTMFSDENKKQCLREYHRVLKPGGLLLTHDIASDDTENIIKKTLTRELNLLVSPLSISGWSNLIHHSGFQVEKYKSGKMSLLHPIGMIKDEGLNAFRVIFNGLKKENRKQFISMFKTLRKHRNHMNYVVFVSRKEKKE